MPRFIFTYDTVLDKGVDPNELLAALNGREGVQVVSAVHAAQGDQYVVQTVNTETREVGTQTVVADTESDAAEQVEKEHIIVIDAKKVETEGTDGSS